jgi:pimeloyl-ACP methyl ester carboxylesterase
LAAFLTGCRAAAWRDYHYSEPVEYYFSYPSSTGIRGAPALFVALLGEGRSPLDCIELFQPFAEDRDFALLCPDLGGEEGLADRAQSERDLADILTSLYDQYSFRDKFYLTGFGQGGEFALEYGMKYPASISGVSAMSVDEYPQPLVPTGAMSVQVLAGESDEDRLSAAHTIEEAWRNLGVLVRVLPVDGNGRSPTQDFARLAAQAIDQIEP